MSAGEIESLSFVNIFISLLTLSLKDIIKYVECTLIFLLCYVTSLIIAFEATNFVLAFGETGFFLAFGETNFFLDL